MERGAVPAGQMEEMLRRNKIELALSHRMELGATWRYDLQSPFWRFYVHDRAGASIIHEGKRILFRPNEFYVIPAWVRFQTETARPVIQDYLHFYIAGFPPSLHRQIFNSPLLLPPDTALQGIVSHWRDGFRAAPGFASLGWAATVAQAAIATVMEELPPAGHRACLRSLTDASTIGPALDRIDHNFSQPPLNAELARLCGQSVDHFIRQFRGIIGMTPARYCLERRVALAAQWLTATPRTIDEIAEASGFTDRFHFSRVFKTRLGLPPATYRRMHRQEVRTSATLPSH